MTLSNEQKLQNFFSSFGAALHLSEKAKETNSYIEQTCLFANLIDGLLRLTIIMKHQLNNHTENINEEYLFQLEEDKIITERKIYKKALDLNIIEQDMFENLDSLYSDRNKIIHRYIISEIKTTHLKKIAKEYDNTLKIIYEIHKKTAEMQKLKKIGIALYFKENATISEIANEIAKKHGGAYKKITPKS